MDRPQRAASRSRSLLFEKSAWHDAPPPPLHRDETKARGWETWWHNHIPRQRVPAAHLRTTRGGDAFAAAAACAVGTLPTTLVLMQSCMKIQILFALSLFLNLRHGWREGEGEGKREEISLSPPPPWARAPMRTHHPLGTGYGTVANCPGSSHGTSRPAIRAAAVRRSVADTRAV